MPWSRRGRRRGGSWPARPSKASPAAYEGAARGRRTEGWRAAASSADGEIAVAGALLRDRMRDLVRNNPHAAKAVAVLVTQARGVPWGAPVIRALRDLDDYEVAEIVRKKTEACVTAIVPGADEAEQGIAPTVVDTEGNHVEQFEPGLIAYARGGKEIRFNQPAATSGYAEYKRASLHTVGAGFRVPYELLTGDLSQVNYSSIRAGLVEFRRMIDAVQWQLFIPMFCVPVWRWFTEAAWAAGHIPEPIVRVEWSPPEFEAVDPQKDAMADLLALRSGTTTLAEAIARKGRNPDAVLAEIAAMNQKLDALGIVLDSDPRRVTKTGVAQATDPAEPSDDDDETERALRVVSDI